MIPAPQGKVFVWVNSGEGTDWQVAMAMAEDGTLLASHVSSSKGWARHDMGLDGSDWKHDTYRAKYPDGFELIWLDGDPRAHEGFAAAYVLNLAARPAPAAVGE